MSKTTIEETVEKILEINYDPYYKHGVYANRLGIKKMMVLALTTQKEELVKEAEKMLQLYEDVKKDKLTHDESVYYTGKVDCLRDLLMKLTPPQD